MPELARSTHIDRVSATQPRNTTRTAGWPAKANLGQPHHPDDLLYDDDATINHVENAESCNLGALEKNVENPSSVSMHVRKMLDDAARPSLDQRFRFGASLAERQRWLEILPDVEPNERTIERFASCGAMSYIEFNTESRSYRIRSNKCKIRICPACRRSMQTKYAARIRQVVGKVREREWQHIVLTMRHTDEPLSQQIKFLRSSFRKLRQRSQWKRSVSDGYAVLEINFNNDKQEWHPHLHILARCKFIDYSALRHDWFQITRGSTNVHCRYLNKGDSAATYVSSYLGKPPSLEMMTNIDRMREYYDAIKSARLLLPFGFNSKLPDAPKSNDPQHAWISKGSLVEFIRKLQSDDFYTLSNLDLIYESRRDIALRIITHAKIKPTLRIEESESQRTTDQHSLAINSPP